MARSFRMRRNDSLERLVDYVSLSGNEVPPPMQVAVHKIPGGDAGTKKTLQVMRKAVHDSIRDKRHGAFLRGLAIKIVNEGKCRHKDFKCEAKALFTWVRDEIRWLRDTRGIETVQYPHRTVAFGGGDCDDKSVLLAALAMAIGVNVAFKAIAADPRRKSQFSHVYVLLDPYGNKKWIPADPTPPNAAFGWESPSSFRELVIQV